MGLCETCSNYNCIFQVGVKRTKCEFYKKQLTNGDIFKCIYPLLKVTELGDVVEVDAHIRDEIHYVTQFDLDWWNAPYKESKVK